MITPEETDDGLKSLPSESSIHLCLRGIDVSDSQMKLSNLHAVFTVPQDPGTGPAFWIVDTQKSFKENGVYKFNEHVTSKGLKVVHTIDDMLHKECINLRYYGIDPRIVEIISSALENNDSVQTIDLTVLQRFDHRPYNLDILMLDCNNSVGQLVDQKRLLLFGGIDAEKYHDNRFNFV